MTKKIITFLVLLLTIFSSKAQENATTETISLELGKSLTIQSSILNEERGLFIHLPKNYDNSEKEYPVIYVLDGQNHFKHAVTAVTILEENGRIPEIIIVAIPNVAGARGRDLAMERDHFMNFIKNEVIPFTEKNYRTNDQRTIFGHSLAGAFTLNYLATEPSLFDNYIVASPVVQIFDSELLHKTIELFNENKTLDKALYITITGVEAEGEEATEALAKLVEILKTEAPESFSWNYDFIENQIHMTTPYLTFYQGLAEVYKNMN